MTTRPPTGRPCGQQPLNPTDAYRGHGRPRPTRKATMTPAQRHAAILAALKEADADANAAGASAESWTWKAQTWPGHPEGEVEDGHGRTLVHDEGTVTAAMAEHIAAYDPNTVRALVAGRRRIVERHAPGSDHMGAGDGWCQRHRDDEGRAIPWPCDDYRDAAADLLPSGKPA